jgi:hypothetical protein
MNPLQRLLTALRARLTGPRDRAKPPAPASPGCAEPCAGRPALACGALARYL